MRDKHEFALFISVPLFHELIITDRDTIFRIQQVLRIAIGDTVIFFNDTQYARATYVSGDKKQLRFSLEKSHDTIPLTPKIHWLLPILEREAFEAALYSATVLGATTIQPIITQKSRQKWGSEKDLERARRIMISAAEQSKQFVLPAINPVRVILNLFQDPPKKISIPIFFDPTGLPCKELLKQTNVQEFTLCIGPEGDLTSEEKQFLKEQGFQFYSLGKSVLRACDAVMVAQGIVRALY